MSGFPIRPTRTAFGPKPENRRPVTNPKQEMDGPTVADLLMWQTSGMGVVSPVATVFIPVVAAAIVVDDVAHAEAWNPDGSLPVPTLTRTGLGVYRVQYAATYADKDGTQQNTALVFGLPIPQGLGASGQRVFATVEKIDVRTFEVRVWRKDTMAADDATVAVLFW